MFDLNIWVLILTAIVVCAILLGVRIYRLAVHFHNPYFALLIINIVGWSCLYALEIASRDLDTMVSLAKAQYFFIATIPPAWLFTSLIISHSSFAPKPNHFFMLLAIPALMILLTCTNEFHHLVWSQVATIEAQGAHLLTVKYGYFFWFYTAYSYSLLAIGTIILFRSIMGASSIYWSQRIAIILGGMVPLAFNLVRTTGVDLVKHIDLSPIAFAFSAVAFTYVYMQRSIVNLRPIARSSIIDYVPVGVVVIDSERRILDVNEELKNLIANNQHNWSTPVSHDVEELLPELNLALLPETPGSVITAKLATETHQFRLQIRKVDSSNLSGHILMLQDITTEEEVAEELADKTTRIREMLDFMPLGIFETDIQGLFTSANRTGLEMTGYDAEEFSRHSVIDTLEPIDAAQANEYLQKWEGGEQFTAEYKVRKKSGDLIPVITQAVPLIDDTGVLQGFRGYTLDLTEQKKTKAALEETEGLYQTLVELSPFGIIVTRHDRILYTNKTMREIVGAPNIDTLLAFRPEDLILHNRQHSGDRQLSLLDLVISERETGNLTHTNLHDVVCQLEYRKTKIDIADTSTSLVIFQDISEKLQNLQTLHEVEQRYLALFSSARDIICITTNAGVIIDVNQAALDFIDYTREELIGKNLLTFTDPADVHKTDSLQSLLQDAELTPEEYPTTFRLLDRNGETIIADVALSLIRQNRGPPFLQFVARDVTREHDLRHDLEVDKELAEAVSSAKTELLTNMSHEIRTPLNSILGIAQLLANEDLNSSQKEQVSRIQRSGDFLMDLINRVLDASKIEAGKFNLYSQTFSTQQLMDELHDIYENLADQKKLDLLITMDPDVPPYLLGDKTSIKQICTNLVGNAIKFTQQGCVTLSLELQELQEAETESVAALVLSVTDTGIGMSQQAANAVFEKFEQEDVSIAQRFGGTGLGLTICKELIGMMGGEISMHSVPGKGSTFIVQLELPVGQHEDLVRDNQVVTNSGSSVEMQTLNVLVAEDDAMNCLLIEEILQIFGCQYYLVKNGQLAIDAVADTNYDLILMDVHMPMLDGLSATRAIRGVLNNNDVAIIAMTAGTTAEEREECFAAGVDDFISKPIDIALLKQKICSVVADKQKA